MRVKPDLDKITSVVVSNKCLGSERKIMLQLG